MLNVTPEAGQLLTDLLEKADAPDGTAARFTMSSQGLQMGLDEPKDEDQVFEHDGKTVLVLEPALNEALADKSLVTTQGEQGQSLAITDGQPPVDS